MKKIALTLLGGTLLTGCGPVETINEQVKLSMPTVWMVSHGKEVDIGGEIVAVMGTDICNTGLGGSFPCWKFSLVDGDSQPVTLSNGIKEIWTTVGNENDSISLVRPNGFVVSSAEKTGCTVEGTPERSEDGERVIVKLKSIECPNGCVFWRGDALDNGQCPECGDDTHNLADDHFED